MLALIQLQTTRLDLGIPNTSPLHMMLFFLMMLAVPMIPYALLYISLRRQESAAPAKASAREAAAGGMFGWLHLHHHPKALHH